MNRFIQGSIASLQTFKNVGVYKVHYKAIRSRTAGRYTLTRHWWHGKYKYGNRSSQIKHSKSKKIHPIYMQ